MGNFEKTLKISDENSIEKLNFLFLFFIFVKNLLLKIEPSEIPPFFYNNSFGFRSGISPFPNGYALARNYNYWSGKNTYWYILVGAREELGAAGSTQELGTEDKFLKLQSFCLEQPLIQDSRLKHSIIIILCFLRWDKI